jgi:hypothetical protein
MQSPIPALGAHRDLRCDHGALDPAIIVWAGVASADENGAQSQGHTSLHF